MKIYSSGKQHKKYKASLTQLALFLIYRASYHNVFWGLSNNTNKKFLALPLGITYYLISIAEALLSQSDAIIPFLYCFLKNHL
ncbi:hypothetical protein EMIT0180MI3_21171 [Priestia megaterium]